MTIKNYSAGIHKPFDFALIGVGIKQAGSLLEPQWLTLSIIPDNESALRSYVTLELIGMTEFSSGDPKHIAQLKPLMDALQPFVQEYRTAILALEQVWKNKADVSATAEVRYAANWTLQRLVDAAKLGSVRSIKKFKPLTAETFEAELTQCGYALKLFSEADRTLARCEMAVQATPNALALVPGQLRSRELCELAVSVTWDKSATKQFLNRSLGHVPINLRDKSMCELALRSDGMNLEHVPKELLTVEMCAIACTQQGLAEQFVPKELKQPEVLFCIAMHGFLEQHSGGIYESLAKTDLPRADAMFDKYSKLWEQLHYPNHRHEQLEDVRELTNMYPGG